MSRITSIFKYALVMREPQNFLGGALFAGIIRASPRRVRKWIALRVLALSPHYFFGSVSAEHARSIASREQLVEDLIAPHIGPDSTVLDYGCGPGYAAKATARRAKTVYAADISNGALEAARALNDALNIVYVNAADLNSIPVGSVDLAYSFAVLQHVGNAIVKDILALLHQVVKPGGKLILHVVLDSEGWRYENDWRADDSFAGKMKLRHGLHCFNRSEAEINALVVGAGFQIEKLIPAAGLTAADQDIAAQHLVYAVRP